MKSKTKEFNFSIDDNRSSYHKAVLAYLKAKYPLYKIAEEMTIHMDNRSLFCDLVVQTPIKVIIEINPNHHFVFVPHFHGTYEKFIDAQARDTMKAKWASMNDYELLILKEEDFKKDEKFKTKIQKVLG